MGGDEIVRVVACITESWEFLHSIVPLEDLVAQFGVEVEFWRWRSGRYAISSEDLMLIPLGYENIHNWAPPVSGCGMNRACEEGSSEEQVDRGLEHDGREMKWFG